MVFIENSFLRFHIPLVKPFNKGLNHYQDIVSWNNIVNARLKGDTLTFDLQKHTPWREKYDVSLSHILKKEELLDDIKALCEAKNIPFEILHTDAD